MKLKSGLFYKLIKSDGNIIFKFLGNIDENNPNDDTMYIEINGETVPASEILKNYISIEEIT